MKLPYICLFRNLLSVPHCHFPIFLYKINLSLPIHAHINPVNHPFLYLSLILFLSEFGFGEVREYQGDANCSCGH